MEIGSEFMKISRNTKKYTMEFCTSFIFEGLKVQKNVNVWVMLLIYLWHKYVFTKYDFKNHSSPSKMYLSYFILATVYVFVPHVPVQWGYDSVQNWNHSYI